MYYINKRTIIFSVLAVIFFVLVIKITMSYVEMGENLTTNRGVYAGSFQIANTSNALSINGIKFQDNTTQSTASWKIAGNNEYLAATTAGGVSIGTSIADGKLTVAGNIKSSGCTKNNGWSIMATQGIGDNLLDVSFVNSTTAIASAGGGIIYRTTDAGLTWKPVTSDSFINGNITCANGTGTCLVTGGNGTIVRTSDNGATWSRVLFWNNGIYDISFVDQNTAIAMLSTGLFTRSTDGGATWTETNLGGGVQIRGLAFNADGSIGIGVGLNGNIVKSTDKGVTWNTINQSITTNNLSGIAFLNNSTAFAVGMGGTVIKTSDGGDTWSLLPKVLFGGLNKIAFANSNNGAIVGNSGIILYTTDGGNTWAQANSNTTYAFNGINFPENNLTGIAVGVSGLIARTTDGGATWTLIKQPTGSFYRLAFGPSGINGVAVGAAGTIYQTANSGATWIQVNSGTLATLYEATFATDSIAFAAGSNGVILKSSDGGYSWATVLTLTDNNNDVFSGLAFKNANFGVGTTIGGYVYRTVDGGTTWSKITTLTAGSQSLVFIPGTDIIAASSFGVVSRSTDGGATWTTVNVGGSQVILGDLAFNSSGFGIAVGGSGKIARTTDNGLTWTTVHYTSSPDGISNTFNASAFYGATAIAAGDGGRIMKSTDNGATWSSIEWGGTNDATANVLNGIAFTSQTNIIGVGSGYSIIRTMDGGASMNKQGTCLDLAELYDNSENLEPGMLVSVSADNPNEVRATKAPYEQELLGVVSTKPAVLFEGDSISMGGNNIYQNKIPLALAGRVKSKVSNENGSIQIGDFITSSSKSGIGMKATKPGTIVGKALEPLNSETGEILILVKTAYFSGI